MTLDNLKVNEKAIIVNMKVDGFVKQRLIDLGFIEGNEIRCVNRGPFGDPKAYEINGSVIALRDCDTKRILVDLRRITE